MATENADVRVASLAYRGLSEIPREYLGALERIHHLDLSHNKFSDLRSLFELTNLTGLILDDNDVTSHAVLPPLPKLELLWVNHNKITNLSIFIESVAANFPNLVQLSMMDNAAAPSYFNGGSKQEYHDYRHYVISHLPKLQQLDDTPVSSEERGMAAKIYGRRRFASVSVTTKKEASAHKKQKQRSHSLHQDVED